MKGIEPVVDYDLNDTVIEMGGVFRCCLGTVAAEYKGKRVRLGDKSACGYCRTVFVLVDPAHAGRNCYAKLTKPLWKPEWQLEQDKNVSSSISANA